MTYSISVIFFFTATNAAQGLADYFVLTLIGNNGSRPQTKDLFEVNRQVLCVYVSEWPVHVKNDDLFRGLCFSVDSEDNWANATTSLFMSLSSQIRGPERVMIEKKIVGWFVSLSQHLVGAVLHFCYDLEPYVRQFEI